MDELVAYGAGEAAKKNISKFNIAIHEIWDKYTTVKQINGIPIVKPDRTTIKTEVYIIVFIDDYYIKNEIGKELYAAGYKNVFHYNDVLDLMRCQELCDEKLPVDERTFKLIELLKECTAIRDNRPSAIYSFLYNNITWISYADFNRDSYERLVNELDKQLNVETSTLREAASAFEAGVEHNKDIRFLIEIFLRHILIGGTKTKYRPLHMVDDEPYDLFAMYVAAYELINLIAGNDNHKKLDFIHDLRIIADSNLVLRAINVDILCRNGEYKQAIALARQTKKQNPNSFLCDDILYKTLVLCNYNGIAFEEPIPLDDLSDRFCWCGIDFAWCGGFDVFSGTPQMRPCFRPLQCAAMPEGDFWKSDDWIEFRKSVVDGSFKYCSKIECPNIVAGWLPIKENIEDSDLKKIFEGNYEYIPDLKELHLSYDTHCNLKCPSCRNEIKVNNINEINRLDKSYEAYLEPIIHKMRHLCLSGCGEAMISPHSRKIIMSLSKEKCPELEVELRTNATALTSESWERLGESRNLIRHIAVSIDASNKSLFEKLRYPAKWENVCNNLKFIKQLRNDSLIDMFEFHVVVQKDNIGCLYDLALMAILYDADCITYSKIINWKGMTESEYSEINPFWIDHSSHKMMVEEFDRIEQLRSDIEKGICTLVNKKFYINIHFRPDPNESYQSIRSGRIRIR